MLFDFEKMTPSERYFLMTQSVVPRPIAWILTRNENGSLNLAPFSFFAPVCANPATFVVSIGKKPDGAEKDTYRNMRRTGEAVLHIPAANNLDLVNESSASLPAEESEVDWLNIETVNFIEGGLPRLQSAPVAYFCRFNQVVELGASPQMVVFLQAEKLYVDESAVIHKQDRTQVDSQQLNPLARLGGKDYAELGALFQRQRPE
jgi:flavin reductase (DIM6/NTAB) family NADH-FMN oxidoreductase RutF